MIPLPTLQELEVLPLVVLEDLEGFDAVTYTPLQQRMLPYNEALQLAWWVVFFATALLLISRWILRPLWQKRRAREAY